MTNRIVVVVGTGGMGMAIARRQGGGRKVLLADFDQSALERSVTALSDEGFDVTAHPVDVASHESVDALAEHAASLGAVTEVVHTGWAFAGAGRPRSDPAGRSPRGRVQP